MANQAAGGGEAASAGRLLHYSATPITLDRAHAYERGGFGKPRGLWLSIEGEDDWPTWCRDNEFGLDRLAFVYEVITAPGANMLLIEHARAFDVFDAAYAPERAGVGADAVALARWDWGKLRCDHDGLIIAPYRWEQRWDSLWYSGWDCASGVIWNLDAIAELRLLAE